MFRCEKCKRITDPREPMTKKVVQTKDRIYTRIDKKTGERKEVGRGFEIVKEIKLCKECV